MATTIFVPCEGIPGKDCFVGIRIISAECLAIVMRRDKRIFNDAIQHVLKERGLKAVF